MSVGKVSENVSLAPFTTLGVGGTARFFVEAHTEKDIEDARALARHKALPLFVLGEGSNILVPDAGVEGVVLKVALRGIRAEEDGDDTRLIAGAGTLWEDVVDEAVARGVFGIENLAGIPGSAGGAAVQNIGAYGAELADVFEYADCVDRATGAKKRVARADAAFAYRTSIFKKNHARIITHIALRLSARGAPNTAYADLDRARAEGMPLSTPLEIARAVRSIRALKFPQNAGEGTAGSFFKNPVVSNEKAAELARAFPGIPIFPVVNEPTSVGGGSASGKKLSLAWLLDHVLSLNGFSLGQARLYEKQPLVIVARAGAHATDVDALATLVAERVFAATGIHIEREVETFGTPQ
ncbi:MAG: UDP-N-acetylmuramate dehydrogenase [Minisyncoccota bacterium]